MSELPSSWQRARLADVSEVRLGRQRSPKRATGDRMRPYLRAANVTWRGLEVSDVKEMDFTVAESATYELRPGDLLLAEASGSPGEVGKPGKYKGEIEGCCFQNTLIRVRLSAHLLPDFYEHFFREQALNGRFAEKSRGVGIHHLGAAGLSDWQVPVPPRAEQERIVAAIEEAFSKLDAGEAGLRTVRQLLKRMREAVLAAAVTGRLLPQDPTDTPATKILADLGVQPLTAQLPPGWARTTFGAVFRVAVGTTPRRDDPSLWGGEVAWVSSGEVAFNRIRRTRETITPKAVRNTGRVLPPGTVMLAIIGEGKTRGQAAILEAPAAHNQNCASIRVEGKGISSEWVFTFLASRYEETRRAGAGNNQPALNKRLVEAIEIPIPPSDEQGRIIVEVERQLSFIEACEKGVDAALTRSVALRRSVLKAAFEGSLVPQDPTDEPASVLLERIRAERTAAPAKAKRSRQKA